MIDYYKELGIDRDQDICLMRGDVINKLREKLEDEADQLGLREAIEEIPAAENIADSKEVRDLLIEIDYRVFKMQDILLSILTDDLCLEDQCASSSIEDLFDRIYEVFGLCVMTRRSYVPSIMPY